MIESFNYRGKLQTSSLILLYENIMQCLFKSYHTKILRCSNIKVLLNLYIHIRQTQIKQELESLFKTTFASLSC